MTAISATTEEEAREQVGSRELVWSAVARLGMEHGSGFTLADFTRVAVALDEQAARSWNRNEFDDTFSSNSFRPMSAGACLCWEPWCGVDHPWWAAERDFPPHMVESKDLDEVGAWEEAEKEAPAQREPEMGPEEAAARFLAEEAAWRAQREAEEAAWAKRSE